MEISYFLTSKKCCSSPLFPPNWDRKLKLGIYIQQVTQNVPFGGFNSSASFHFLYLEYKKVKNSLRKQLHEEILKMKICNFFLLLYSLFFKIIFLVLDRPRKKSCLNCKGENFFIAEITLKKYKKPILYTQWRIYGGRGGGKGAIAPFLSVKKLKVLLHSHQI